MTDAAPAPLVASTPAPKEIWSSLARPVPDWLRRAKLGIFVHWGAYSVPAWAEPSGALGTLDDREWFVHNAYAEWYANTMRIPGSPTARRHADVYADAPYDDFLDQWTAERFDPAAWAELFAAAGASHVVLTTKHHDGIALWDAPGTGTRNTVHRGPRRDLVGELADAVRAQGLRFGTYYSGGLDWGVTDYPPIRSQAEVGQVRPRDAAYNFYAVAHVRDLIERYRPDVIFNDIEWPDAGKRSGAWSLHELLGDYYAGNPDGVVNDRWGDTHWDYRTSEYELDTDHEVGVGWEQCRGIGLSFGYNQVETSEQYLDGRQLARLLGDVVSRGGRLLLNVGPTADGEIPEIQQASLRGLGRWLRVVGPHLADAQPVDAQPVDGQPVDGQPARAEDPWVRWLQTPSHLVALVDGSGAITVPGGVGVDLNRASAARASVTASAEGALTVTITGPQDGPALILLPQREG